MVSQAYEVLFGVVEEVRTGDTIVVRSTPRTNLSPFLPVFKRFDQVHSKTVRLVNVDAPIDSQRMATAAKAELIRLVQGKKVSLAISPYQGADGTLTAIVDAEGVGDVGERMLTEGLATYRSFGAYAIDWWLECHYELARARAKDAKVGIWARPDEH